MESSENSSLASESVRSLSFLQDKKLRIRQIFNVTLVNPDIIAANILLKQGKRTKEGNILGYLLVYSMIIITFAIPKLKK